MSDKISDMRLNITSQHKISFYQIPHFMLRVQNIDIEVSIHGALYRHGLRQNSHMTTIANTIRYVNKERYGILEKISENMEYYNYSSYIKSEKISFSAIRKSSISHRTTVTINPISAYKFMVDEDEEEDDE